MKKSEHGGAVFVTGIRRTLEPGVDGEHAQHMETSVRFQAAGVAMKNKMGTNSWRTTSYFVPWCENLSKEHAHHKQEWTLSNSNSKVFVRFFRQPQNSKRVYCELTGNPI